MADYNYQDYLGQVPEYQQTKTSAEMLAQAKAASNLAYDPIRQEAERQRKFNEMQQYNTMNKLNSSQAGLDKTLAFSESQAKKANAINAAARGGKASDGLSSYLNNLTDTALAGQRLNIQARLNADKYNAEQNYLQQDADSQKTLSNIEAQRGNAQQVYYTNQEDLEANRKFQWDTNALNVANAIGAGVMNAEDINARLQMAADSIASQERIAEMNNQAAMDRASLEWDRGPTWAQKDASARAWTELFGGLPGYDENTGQVGLSSYASAFGGQANSPTVGWDANSGNVIIKNASGITNSYTPETLTGMGAVLVDGRWKMSQATADQLLFNK